MMMGEAETQRKTMQQPEKQSEIYIKRNNRCDRQRGNW